MAELIINHEEMTVFVNDFQGLPLTGMKSFFRLTVKRYKL